MPDLPTDSGASTESVSSPAVPVVSPSAAFSDDVPNWIKEAGLQEAHRSAKPPGASATPSVPAQPAAPATPPVTAGAPAQNLPGNQIPPPTATPNPTPAAVPGALPQMDADTLTRMVVEGVRAAQQPAQTAPDDAAIAKQLGIFTATPEVFKSILGIDPQPEQVVALNNAFQAVSKQSVNIMNVLMKQQLQSIREEIAPYISTVREQEATRQQDIFYKEHADLAGFRPLVESTFRNIMASGQKFPDITTVRKHVADQTRALLQASGIQLPKPGTVPQNTPRTTTSPSRPMSPASTGGRNGGGQPAKPASTMDAVWGTK